MISTFGRSRVRPLLRLGAVCFAGALFAGAGTSSASAASPACPDAFVAALGPNVCVFTDTMSQMAIQNDLNNIASQQVPIGSQFSSRRYAILFQPGAYGSAANPLVFQVGYYTEVAGLGFMPQDTVINGAIDVFNNLCTPGTSFCNSLDNFWRSLSNLTLNVHLPSSPPAYAPATADPFGPGCDNSAEMWSVSQAAPIRRAIINGSVVFQDYCASNNFASGGFIADSEVSGNLNFFGNQQYMVRNSAIGGANGCPNGLWNMVYSGVQGAPAPVFTGQCQQNTVLAASPVTEEEPFLYTDAQGDYNVFVPAVRRNSVGTTWGSGATPGKSIPIKRFFIATPTTPVGAINTALDQGKNLILTPGVYELARPIEVTNPGTIVLGLGFPTLVPQNGTAGMEVVDVPGVKLSGMIFDAGPVNSRVLLQLGQPQDSQGEDDPAAPTLVQDVFFRIGGATAGEATSSLVVNTSNVILDDVWAWRADHGTGVGWTDNVGDHGLVVNGTDVTAYGLFVEHYEKSQVVWNGQNGEDIFFQNELPYDPPNQAAWMASPTQDGYPAFEVGSSVTAFQGYGMGSYVVFIQTAATLHNAEAFEAPDTPGVQFHNIFGVWIAGSGGDDSIINGTGGPVTSTNPGTVRPVDLSSYP
jgi:hypothetical protein